MNSVTGFLVPPENNVQIGVPLTPGEPNPQRPNEIPVEKRGNQLERANRHQLSGVPNQHLQQPMNYEGSSHNFNVIGPMDQSGSSYSLDFTGAEKRSFGHNVGSYAQSFWNGSTAWSNNPLAEIMAVKNTMTSVALANGSMNAANTRALLNSYPQVNSNWTEANFTSLLLETENPNSGALNLWNNADRLQQIPRDKLLETSVYEGGFNALFWPNNDLNSRPRSEADVTSSTTNSAPIAPVTPDHIKQFEKHHHSESSSQEKDNLENLLTSIGGEANENHCKAWLQNIVDHSSVLISAMSDGKNNSEGGEQSIDMNKTPQQKPPKRRKHRPKVVVEGKQKRTPKPKNPKKTNSKENPSGKRKYVRKKIPEETSTQRAEATNEVAVPTFESKVKSCRRKLDFDWENDKNGERKDKAADLQVKIHQENQASFHSNLDSQATELSTSINNIKGAESAEIIVQSDCTGWNHKVGHTGNLANSMNQMPAKSISLAERGAHTALPAAIKYNTSNVIARSLNMKNVSLYQKSDKKSYSKEHQHLQGEVSMNISQANAIHINLDESMQMTCQTTPQMEEGNMVNSNDKRGPKRDYHHAIEQAGPTAKNQIVPILCPEISQVNKHNCHNENYGTNCSEADKKKKKENGCYTTVCAHTTVCSTPCVTVKDGSRKAPTFGYEKAIETYSTNLSVRGCNMRARGQPEKQKFSDTIDGTMPRLQRLSIPSRKKETIVQDKKPLVPYNENGTVIPYERFDPIKRFRQRPKVDLDPETIRVWNLLMGKEGSEGTEADDKGKWWEEERKVFSGRVDSFIARMHLVQGDRRFSQWKGSVVDSVIGVFLTQNVSDHLSSSAFMSLAARFPHWSSSTKKTYYQSRTNIVAEEPEIQVPEPECYEKIARQPKYNHGSVIYHQSSESRIDDPNSGTRRTSLATERHGIGKEKASSSQKVFEPYVLQVNGKIQSYSVYISEAEDSSCRVKTSKLHGPLTRTHMGTPSFPVHYSSVAGALCFDDRFAYWHKQSGDIDYRMQRTQKPRLDPLNNMESSSTLTPPINYKISHMTPDLAARDIEYFGMLRNKGISSTAFGMTKQKAIDSLNRTGHTAERIYSKTVVQQNGVPRVQEPTIAPHIFLSKNPTHQENSLWSVCHTGKDKHFATQQEERLGNFQLKRKLVEEPIRPKKADSTTQNASRHQVPTDPKNALQGFGEEVNKQKNLDTKVAAADAKEQVYFSGVSKTTTGMQNMSNARKGKAEGKQRTSFDWDSLRKLVQPNGKKKERSKDTMDSLDYEAVRCADINEISETIKERGLNYLLAKRIKDFLNRMVREHGSIDLEWLRDVPPDKAKDYLLNIEGLGLKSVECVRLLTLHHLAFPVDTNVGRIAVRLGWVPLKPLPESLQLHLLELYPMLDTIQKYLWPRLCKLDQRTLYELHYQMITFGKVFCTKSKPNCNACPMRAECKHFASAFASTRLALPGPDKRCVVSTPVPSATDRIPAVAIKPIPLPPAESYEPKQTKSVMGNCEPIVEEPTTPEPETAEVSDSDIEDAFYEHPDEIPTINLNIEEFTQNLHNYMKENMELQESEMSKALVALNPEVASIPTPKLKNVSRLRTEHQVYELPDSHPLLKGLDKREPDDPCSYLLAIWTPGETENSVQPPETRCGSQEPGKLCNEKICLSCNSVREANSPTVRGTLLIPCRTAMKGSFPLNGTYFQVNEVFADHESSVNPIDVPRAWIWNLPRRIVYFGSSVSTIFRGLTTEAIQYCFWRGLVCVRGFDQKRRAPRPLVARLHFPASKLTKTKSEDTFTKDRNA